MKTLMLMAPMLLATLLNLWNAAIWYEKRDWWMVVVFVSYGVATVGFAFKALGK